MAGCVRIRMTRQQELDIENARRWRWDENGRKHEVLVERTVERWTKPAKQLTSKPHFLEGVDLADFDKFVIEYIFENWNCEKLVKLLATHRPDILEQIKTTDDLLVMSDPVPVESTATKLLEPVVAKPVQENSVEKMVNSQVWEVSAEAHTALPSDLVEFDPFKGPSS